MAVPDNLDSYRRAAAEYERWRFDLTNHYALSLREATRRGNRAADELRRLATEIGADGPDAVRAFGGLLDESQDGIRYWAAFHLLEVMPAPLDLVDRAFDLLEQRAQGDDLDAFGTRCRLEELHAEYGRSARDE